MKKIILEIEGWEKSIEISEELFQSGCVDYIFPKIQDIKIPIIRFYRSGLYLRGCYLFQARSE